jgi:hypothetical protein
LKVAQIKCVCGRTERERERERQGDAVCGGFATRLFYYLCLLLFIGLLWLGFLP